MIVHENGAINQLLDAALGYARRGWPVLPLHTVVDGRCTCDDGDKCGTPGKHPLTLHGSKDATTNEAVVRQWWAEASIANVGIATGPQSFFMLGPDGPEGVAELVQLQEEYGPLPKTPLVGSGGGTGEHYYLLWPEGGGVRTLANINGTHIDVRGEGGFVVAPPSAHVSGGHYSWKVHVDDAPLAGCPDGLLEWVRTGKGTNKPAGAKKTAKAERAKGFSPANGKVRLRVGPSAGDDPQGWAVAYLAKCDPAISGQGGHSQTLTVARAVVRGFNLGPEVGYEVLARHYNPRCQPPWSEQELRHKCDEAQTKPFDKPVGWLLQEREAADVGGNFVNSSIRSPSQENDGSDIEAIPMPAGPPWPELPEGALYGVVGEVVKAIDPHTEADPAATLGQLLAAFGNAVGREPHFMVEGDRHHANLYVCLVGKSSRGRKGTSRGRVMQIMEFADQGWFENCLASGLSSGEGLIWCIRDPIVKKEAIKEKGRVTGYQEVVADEGVEDKRLLVEEGEFAQVLKVLQREGNTLSPVIRAAWDTGNLRILTKANQARATGAHVSISAHITQEELQILLKKSELFNGFANRFLWFCTKRSKELPKGGGQFDPSPYGVRLSAALAATRNVGRMTRSGAADRLWCEHYPILTAERSGLYGAVTSRAEAQVLRLSMLFATLDCSSVIDEQHIGASLALWSYADASARYIFGEEQEDPLVGMVLAKLLESPGGLTRTDLHNAFNRNIPAEKLIGALAVLRDRGQAEATKEPPAPGGHKPRERWKARRMNEFTNLPGGGPPGGDGKFVNTSLRNSPAITNGTEEEVRL